MIGIEFTDIEDGRSRAPFVARLIDAESQTGARGTQIRSFGYFEDDDLVQYDPPSTCLLYTSLELKPYLAIVRNQNPRTVVAYTVSWTVTLRNGMSEVHNTQFKFPDVVAGTNNGLALLQGLSLIHI